MGVADDFRSAMEGPQLPPGSREVGVSIVPWLPCECGCGRPAGVAIITAAGTFLLREPAEVQQMARMLVRSALALGWRIPADG